MVFKWPMHKGKKKEFEFKCSECDEVHTGSPSFSHNHPALVYSIPEEERENRLYLTDDLCVVDDKHFFIRVVLEVPIIGMDDPFTWGVWVSQSEENFMSYQNSFGADQSGNTTFGWLVANVAYYSTNDSNGFYETLKCDVHWREKGKRPYITLHEVKHELFEDQQNGISWNKAIEIAQIVMHPKAG